jgi:hypothetical protein
MFDFMQLGLIMAVAAAILGSALAYAWRDATRDTRGQPAAKADFKTDLSASGPCPQAAARPDC